MVKKTTKKPANKRVTKNPWVIIVLLLLIIIGGMMAMTSVTPHTPTTSEAPVVESTLPFDFNNETVTLNNQELHFLNGSYKSSDGQDVAIMMNRTLSTNNNRAAAIMMDNPGGSGTFYYLVGGMTRNGIEVFSTPILLGDRIQIVSVSVEEPEAEDNGEIIIEYLDRPEGAPMAADPTEKKTVKYAFQEDGNLISVLN